MTKSRLLTLGALILFLSPWAVFAQKGKCKRGNCINGSGLMEFPSGQTYDGKWRKGKFNGKGTYRFPSGTKYVGEFKEGQFEGQGSYDYASGAKYIGAFHKGEYHGQGSLTDADGSRFVGEFKNGKRQKGKYSSAPEPLGTEKSPSTAFWLSFGSTVVPVGLGIAMSFGNLSVVGVSLFGGGLILGPSVGHWYARRVWRGIGTSLLRVGVGAVGFIAGFAAGRSANEGETYAGLVEGVVAGFVAITIVAIYDIATAADSARMYNKERKKKQKLSWRIIPLIDPLGDRLGAMALKSF